MYTLSCSALYLWAQAVTQLADWLGKLRRELLGATSGDGCPSKADWERRLNDWRSQLRRANPGEEMVVLN